MLLLFQFLTGLFYYNSTFHLLVVWRILNFIPFFSLSFFFDFEDSDSTEPNVLISQQFWRFGRVSGIAWKNWYKLRVSKNRLSHFGLDETVKDRYRETESTSSADAKKQASLLS